MNRTIKEATVRRYHYDSHNQLREHLDLYGAFSVNHLFIVSFFVRSGVRFFAPIRSSA